MMRIQPLLAAAALALSGCFVVPVTGPTTTTTPISGPSVTPSLRNQLAGRSLVDSGHEVYLWSDGSLTLEGGRQQFFGSWTASGNTLSTTIIGNEVTKVGRRDQGSIFYSPS